jgi:hypothetical protein
MLPSGQRLRQTQGATTGKAGARNENVPEQVQPEIGLEDQRAPDEHPDRPDRPLGQTPKQEPAYRRELMSY